MNDFFKKIKGLEPVYDLTYNILLNLCKLMLIGDIFITLWAVAGRYIPFIGAPSWSEEIILTLMVYIAVFSAALAIRKGAHIRMTAFDRGLGTKALIITDIISDILVMALGIVMLTAGIQLLDSPLCRLGTYASLPSLSKFWQYLPIAAAGASMVIFELEQLFKHLEKLLSGEEENEKEE